MICSESKHFNEYFQSLTTFFEVRKASMFKHMGGLPLRQFFQGPNRTHGLQFILATWVTLFHRTSSRTPRDFCQRQLFDRAVGSAIEGKGREPYRQTALDTWMKNCQSFVTLK